MSEIVTPADDGNAASAEKRLLIQMRMHAMYGEIWEVIVDGKWEGTFPTEHEARQHIAELRVRRGVPLFCVKRGCVRDATIGNYCADHAPSR